MRTILVFDTETTGKWDFSCGTHADHQPHAVQIAAKLYHDRVPVTTWAALVDSDFESHPEAEAIHKKTMDLRRKFGLHYDNALRDFLYLTSFADLVVAHNFDFDSRIIGRGIEWWAHIETRPYTNNEMRFIKMPNFCTMKAATPICRLPGPRGFKWPKLSEAYEILVDPAGFEGAHDALSDVEACAEILWRLIDQGAGPRPE